LLHLLYAEPNKTLRGLAGFLSDPSRKLEETINYMLAKEHDADGSMGWRDYQGKPTRKHPIVAESMREMLSKSDNERSGVFSTVLSFLSLYRDPVVAANTEHSEFKISDLVNHERPVSLYLVVPMASRDRLRPLMRLILNQIIRTLTTTLNYKDGRAVSANRHPLLMMLDEFPTLGHLAVLGEALSLIAGYGIRACLVAQDLAQIYQAYGRNQSVSGNCHTTVAFTPAPNNTETAEVLADMIGETSVRHIQRTTSSSGRSLSEPETRRSLMTPDEVLRMPTEEVLIFTRGCPAIRTRALQYYKVEALKQRGSIPPPATSDHRIVQRRQQTPHVRGGGTMTSRQTLETLRRLGPEKVLDGMELCPSCDSLSPCIAMDGETVMHCPVCHDQGMVTVEAADRWRRRMQELYGSK